MKQLHLTAEIHMVDGTVRRAQTRTETTQEEYEALLDSVRTGNGLYREELTEFRDRIRNELCAKCHAQITRVMQYKLSVAFLDGMSDGTDSKDTVINRIGSAGTEWEDYEGYPFAMETVNGDMIRLDGQLQKVIRKRFLAQTHQTQQQLLQYIRQCLFEEGRRDEEPENLCEEALDTSLIEDAMFELDDFMQLIGYSEEKDRFTDEGIGFMEGNGMASRDFLEALGFELEEYGIDRPYGEGVFGVAYYEPMILT